MMEPMAVAVHSIRKISPDKNDSIVVCGLGTIGMFILMFLIEMGYENLFVIGNKDFQKETVLKLGIKEEPCAYHIRYEELIDPDFGRGYGFEFGEVKPLINWFEEKRRVC